MRFRPASYIFVDSVSVNPNEQHRGTRRGCFPTQKWELLGEINLTAVVALIVSSVDIAGGELEQK